MIKKILCLILSVVCLFSVAPISVQAATSNTMTTLNALVNKFPQGKYWNHVGTSNQPDGVTSTPCATHSRCHWGVNCCNCNSFDNAIQCMGYAHKISYEITGVYPRNNYRKITTLKASDLRVGDIIRYRWDGHSICVTGVKGNKISFTDCNYIGKCQIRWAVMDISELVGFTYVLRLDGNTRKNSDLKFYENIDSYVDGLTLKANFETWRTKDSVINIRSTRRTSANIIGKLPTNTEIPIYDKYNDGTYLWGKVTYGDLMGWCVLNYSEYVDGYIEKPNFKNTNEAYLKNDTINLSWNEVTGTTEYILYLYGSNGALLKEYRINGEATEKSIQLKNIGQYTAEIIAINNFAPSWQMRSNIYSFSIIDPDNVVYVKSLKFDAPDKIVRGTSFTAKAEVTPEWASDCGVNWKTSDKTIATVNQNGKITAKKYGKVTITCTAADRGKVSYKKEITIVPDSPENITQTGGSTTSVTFKWSKVDNAKFYAVYKYNTQTKAYEKIDTCTETTYTMKVSAGSTNKVKVHAVAKADSKNYYSMASDILTVVSSPKAPELTVKSGYKKAVLSWNEVKGATHYVVYQVVDGKNVKLATISADGSGCEYTVSNLKNGNYVFKVRSVRKADSIKGYGSYSKEVKFKV